MSQNKYPLIKKFLPELIMNKSISFGDVFRASDLEAILAKGQILHGCKRNKQGKDNWAWDNNYTDDTTTHTCLAIGIQPIESQEPVSKRELIEKLEDALLLLASGKFRENTHELISRIKKNGVRND